MPATRAESRIGKRKLKFQKIVNPLNFQRTICGRTLCAPDARNAKSCNVKVKAIQEISILEIPDVSEFLFFRAAQSGITATIASGLDSPETRKITIEVHLNLKKKSGQAEMTVVKMKSCHLAFPKFPILLSLADGTNATIALPSSASDVLFVRTRTTANTTAAVEAHINVVINDAKIAV